MFSKLFILSTVLSLRKKFAPFQVESVLIPFTFKALIKKTKQTTFKELSFEKRLSLSLENGGISVQNLALFLSFYPEIMNEKQAVLLKNALKGVRSYALTATDSDTKDSQRFLKAFYLFAKKDNALKPLAQHFETFSQELSDFQLEAACLERLHDLFYEEEKVAVLLPDWIKTNKNQLVQEKAKGQTRSLHRSKNKEKTLRTLIKIVVTAFFEEGIAFLPSLASCVLDENENICLTRARLSFNFPIQQRAFIFSAFQAFLKNKDKTLLPQKFTLCSEKLKQSEELSSRVFLCALIDCQTLCQDILKTEDFFYTTLQEELSALNFVAKKTYTLQGQAQAIQETFALPLSQEERFKYRHKTPPSFQKNFKKIGEMLLKQSYENRFLTKKKTPLSLLFFILFFLALLTLSSYLKIW